MSFALSALEALGAALRRSPHQIALTVQRGDDVQLSTTLETIARQICTGAGPALGLGVTNGDVPALVVTSSHRPPVTYRALPEGSEAQVFLDLLLALAESKASGDAGSPAAPVHLLVFIAPGCPSCPHAVRAAALLAASSPADRLTVADATLVTDLAERHRVRTVPTTIIDDDLTLTGVVSPRRLNRLIRERATPVHRRRVFESLMETGRFREAASRLMEDRELHEHFAALWRSSTLESRLRLMLVVEEADAACLAPLASLVRPALTADSAPLRGDTADLIGRIGGRESMASLESLITDPSGEVVEAAEEARATLRARLHHHAGTDPSDANSS